MPLSFAKITENGALGDARQASEAFGLAVADAVVTRSVDEGNIDRNCIVTVKHPTMIRRRPHLRTSLFEAVPESAPSARQGVRVSASTTPCRGSNYLGAGSECLREGQEVDYE